MTSSPKPSVTIFHNPACSSSRHVLALIREQGLEPEVVEYLKQPYTHEQLAGMLQAGGVTARDWLREKGDLFESLGLADPACTEAQLIEQMVAHPVLVNRPIVVTDKGTRLCRPVDSVLELLP